MWRNLLGATGAACRRIWVVLVVALGLMTASCDKPGESEDEACDWPQPFDVAPGETAQVKASVAECSAEVDEYVDRLWCAELQADAVANELLLHAVYMPHLVPGATLSSGSAAASRDAITTIRLDVAGWPYPPACRDVRLAFLEAMRKVEGLYDGLDRKGRRRISWEVQRSRRAVSRFRDLAAALQPAPELMRPEPYPIEARRYVEELIRLETTPWSPPAAVMAEWNRLVDANVPDDDPAMRRVMRQMDRPTCPYPWENKRHFIPPRFNGTYDWGMLQRLDELGWILTGGKYQAFMFDAYVTWRGGLQFEAFGGSNYSEMPNDEYNQVRFIALRTIQRHLREHPQDNWARLQKAGLLAVSNIKRGGMFGSISGCGSEGLMEVLTTPPSENNENR